MSLSASLAVMVPNTLALNHDTLERTVAVGAALAGAIWTVIGTDTTPRLPSVKVMVKVSCLSAAVAPTAAAACRAAGVAL